MARREGAHSAKGQSSSGAAMELSDRWPRHVYSLPLDLWRCTIVCAVLALAEPAAAATVPLLPVPVVPAGQCQQQTGACSPQATGTGFMSRQLDTAADCCEFCAANSGPDDRRCAMAPSRSAVANDHCSDVTRATSRDQRLG